jgi:hypothetical protein
MNKNLKLLNTLIELNVIDLKDYYVITIYEYKLNLQGHYKAELLVDLIDKGFTIIENNGYTVATKENIEITLTN